MAFLVEALSFDWPAQLEQRLSGSYRSLWARGDPEPWPRPW